MGIRYLLIYRYEYEYEGKLSASLKLHFRSARTVFGKHITDYFLLLALNERSQNRLYYTYC